MDPSHIYITGLFQMPGHVRELGPTHLISVIQPEFQPQTPPEIAVERHLRVAVHDVWEHDGSSILAQSEDVCQLIEFAEAWSPRAGSLLIHCYAGVSRSTAAALIAHVIKTADPAASAHALRRAAPHAIPNRRIIALADEELGFRGELSRAVENLGPPTVWLEEEVLADLELS